MAKELAAGLMYRPTAIVHHLESVYVVEQYNHRVSKWDFDAGATPPANFIFTLDDTWGSNGNGTSGLPGRAIADDDEFFNFPTGITIYSNAGFLFVTDTLNNRIRVLNFSDGSFVKSFVTTPGTGDGQLYRPTHIGFNGGEDIVAVADSGNHRVSIYNGNDQTFMDNADPPPEGFHTPGGIHHSGPNETFYYSDLIRGKIYAYLHDDGTTPTFPFTIGTPGTDPTVPNELFYPGASTGNTGVGAESLLTDTRNNKIKFYTEPGVISDKIIGEGTTEGKFYYPEDSAGFSQTDDYLLVCNTLNNRIEVFDRADNTFQSTFGSPTPVLP